ncbi:MAG: hypothetical protein CML66_19125 [Rhodobacteraceae bacterium]|nr:hypothetical protein [Paracoccaceae bacterium]MAY45563.1 hypothetical protein [Paracoccaceae bacterium]QEW21639.1 hypothetical protein LA6_003851 [Marinibacterium anthonyi]
MGKAKYRDLPDLSDRAMPGAEITVRATPKAGRDRLLVEDDTLRAYVTAVPENGKANDAVRAMLAAAMKVAPTELELIRGQTSREKTFRYRALSGS